MTVKSTFYKDCFLIDKAPRLMYNNYNNKETWCYDERFEEKI